MLDFPDALKEKLLEYLPKDDAFVSPPKGRAEPTEEAEPVIVQPKLDPIALEQLRQRVWAFIRQAPARPDGVRVAVETSAVDPWPHQWRAYHRMVSTWPFRLLIADEVGLGKTIEAGMLIRHSWIAGLAKRILIMVPKGVIRQWQAELYEKFNLLVPIYDGQALVWPEHHGRQMELVRPVSRDAWTKEPLVLVSSHLMRRRERQPELLDAVNWDLLVLDEAHHARRSAPGTAQEGGPNRLLGLMRPLREKAKSLLLLTATPMQVHPVELWDLLSLLKLPEAWTREAFLEYFDLLRGNPDEKALLRLAKLFQATEATYGPAPENEIGRICQALELTSLSQQTIMAALREKVSTIPFKRLNTAQRRGLMAILRGISPVYHCMSRHTRSLLRKYYERGLLDSPIATRDPQDIPVELSPSERAVYDEVEKYIREIYQAASEKKKSAVGFVMTIYRRRLASSFHALRHTLESRLEQLGGAEVREDNLEEDLLPDERRAEVMSSDEAADMERETLLLEEKDRILGIIKNIAKLGTDTKARRLADELLSAERDGFQSVIIFTQYTDTMDYLKEFLADRLDWPIGCYSGRGGEKQDASGAWAPCSKEQVKRMLRDGQIQILVCTDAAGEGLNLQFCGMLVNYDLPWNPMKVEQRIGRIDRIGQKHTTIRILNLAYADTVEADVYFALSKRIGLFHGVVGKLQPILSLLPGQFERATLEAGDDPERARHEAVAQVEGLIATAEKDGFDIDAVTEADLQPPDLPPSPISAGDMDIVLRACGLLPSGVQCTELDAGTYSLCLPGMTDAVRVTGRPAIFDECFESHQLLWYGGPMFGKIAERCGGDLSDQPVATGTLLEMLKTCPSQLVR